MDKTALYLLKVRTDQAVQKLHMCLDPTNLNKAIVCELYHFKTLEDIAHLIA